MELLENSIHYLERPNLKVQKIIQEIIEKIKRKTKFCSYRFFTMVHVKSIYLKEKAFINLKL